MAPARTRPLKRILAQARRAHENDWFERAARAGFAINGLLHVLIGVLAILVATGVSSGSDDADPSGAIQVVADTPGGILLVWVIAAGLATLALWLLLEAVLGHFVNGKLRTGIVVLGKAAAYGALAVPAVTIGVGGRVDSDGEVREVSAFLVQTPFGIVVLGLAGLIVIIIGVCFVVIGARRTFLQDIRTPSGTVGTAVIVLGIVGYTAKGLAFAAVGVLLIVTAITVDPAVAGGLDEAIRTVVQLPFGAPLLGLVAVGFIAFGLYCGVRARRSTI